MSTPSLPPRLENLEKARKQSDAQAQLVDEKHVTEALIQANRFLTSTTEAFEKGDKAEQERLAELKKAVADQLAFIAQRAKDCSAFIQQIQSTITQLDVMKSQLLAKATPAEPEVQPAIQEIAQPMANEKLDELNKIIAEVKLPAEIAKKFREDVTVVFAPSPTTNAYGKASTGSAPAALAATTGPYHKAPAEDKDKVTEAAQGTTG